MMRRKLVSFMMVGVLAMGMLTGCGSSSDSSSADSKDGEQKDVLRVGMECAYAPFNWTQDSEEVSNGEKALPMYEGKTYTVRFSKISYAAADITFGFCFCVR